jgi:DNA-directed RNA polymerase sigma subunit (sigma70/sigma32)
MGLRNRSSLKRCADGGADKTATEVASQRSKRRSALKQVAVHLVSSDPALTAFLKSPDSSLSKGRSSDVEQEVTAVKVEKAISTLGKLEAEVIEALFPSSGATPESFEDLARRLGMTTEEVKSIADNALRGLRGTRHAGARLSTVWN